ncbi:MAG: hypothetical protein WA902_08155, partial [Thermosynechococcaceae cyanobacterium]
MIRTVISLNEDDKRWLDRQAKQQQTTLANLIQKAVRQMRQTSELQEPSFDHLLAKTQGIWEEGN